ncbi:SDR family oxidoreductase [Novosphingobium colocasiae]|nr:SDR family oxidoreductase [Novosphingobium colocasiae]
MGRMDGKVVIVTGAAAGLGEADARLLAEEGATVVMTDINVAAGEAAAAAIGGRTEFRAHDVTVEAQWEDLFAHVLARHGRVDGLVNNAGFATVGAIDNVTEADWRKVMAVSADGTMFGCKHAVRAMRGVGGSIVNMASLSSLRGHWRFTAYCAAKGAVESLTRAIAVYSLDEGLKIRCNSLHPSGFDTNMVRDVGPLAKELKPFPDLELGKPIDIARAVLFLLSDESHYINGVALSVDNGLAQC